MHEDEIRQIARQAAEQVLQENRNRYDLYDLIFKWVKWGAGLLFAIAGIIAVTNIGKDYFGDDIRGKVEELREVGIKEVVHRVRSFSSEKVEVYQTEPGSSLTIENAAFCALTQTDGTCALVRNEQDATLWTLQSSGDETQCHAVCMQDASGHGMQLGPDPEG